MELIIQKKLQNYRQHCKYNLSCCQLHVFKYQDNQGI
jgi:hypothetical protein